MESPKELGLPEKFHTGWRNGQGEIIDEVAQSGSHYFLLDAPTGVGKSVIGIASYAIKELWGRVRYDFPGYLTIPSHQGELE